MTPNTEKPAIAITPVESEADRFRALACDVIDLLQMSRLATSSIEDALEQPSIEGKPDLIFIDVAHRSTLVFAAQHLQDMIDVFRGKFFDIVEGVSADNPRRY